MVLWRRREGASGFLWTHPVAVLCMCALQGWEQCESFGNLPYCPGIGTPLIRAVLNSAGLLCTQANTWLLSWNVEYIG